MPTPTDLPTSLTGELLLLLAGLAALGALATNIILLAFPDIGTKLRTSVKDLSATLGRKAAIDLMHFGEDGSTEPVVMT